MNVQLKDITVTARDGRVSHLDQVYIRGSHVRFFIVPDMLRFVKPFLLLSIHSKPLSSVPFLPLYCSRPRENTNTGCNYRNAPMFRSIGVKGRGVGLARGRATVSRARASGRGAARG